MTVQIEKPAVVPDASDPAWAWAPYRPDARRPWDLALAGHLYRRAAFGANWGQLQRALADGPQPTIDNLLRPQTDPDAFNREYDEYEAAGSDSAEALRAWWLRRMIGTPHPLLEKMTLFWHGHFATSNVAVKNARLMHRHVQLLRRHALGCFRPLLEAVSRDPAVLVALGADANRKALPNESFARALMQHFTLGPGRYAEKDVREAARAFTGRFVISGKLRHIPREHDEGTKQLLGNSGRFTGDDVMRIVLDHTSTPGTLVRGLYRWLISETEPPEPRVIAPLAESFAKDYDVLKLVETMLRSNLFFSPAAYRRRIKCPVEFAVGIIRGLEAMISTTRLGQDLADLGQNLYHPPTVNGWAGGRHWIGWAAMVQRHNLARALLRGADPYGDKLDPQAVARKHGHSTPQSAGRFLLDLFLQADLEPGASDALMQTLPTPAGPGGGDPSAALRRFAHAVVTVPEFHLA